MKINLIHKNIAILGYGKEGASTLKFLKKNGILDGSITVLDKNPVVIEDFYGNIITGDNYLDNLDKYDYIFKSPGISPYTNNLLKYKDKILTQTKLFYEFYKGKIISVTQTKGKSTTATLCYQLLKNAGHNVKLVGNIGTPVLDEIDITKDNFDYVVYELSSYMLEDLDNHHSYISILGNIYEDHLDWHLGFENYSRAKKNVLKNSENILVGLDLSRKIEKDLLNRKFLSFGSKGAYLSHEKNEFFIKGEQNPILVNPKIPGEHNLDNFAGILGVSQITGVPNEIFIQTINEFYGLPHRLENIGTFAGITFINDANATTPEASMEAIKTFKSNIGTIFLGGQDRGYNFNELCNLVGIYNIENIVLFPDSGDRIEKLLPQSVKNILKTKSMKLSVEFAYNHTKSGQVCLMSCGSPSYGIWKNFEQKGDEFKNEILNQYKKFEQ